MEELAGWFLMIVAAIAVVGALIFYTAWIVLAALARILAWLLVYWIVTASLGVVLGVVTALVQPSRVLQGKAHVQPDVATPQLAASGELFKTKGGAKKHFGWDRGWPTYVPYQARRDAAAVFAQARYITREARTRSRALLLRSGKGAKVGLALDSAPGAVWLVLVPLPIAAFMLGLWISTLAWGLIMTVLASAISLMQTLVVQIHKWTDRGQRRRTGAVLRCARCYRTSTTPSYRCSNAACSIVHHDVSPGRLGVLHRRCECGERLPTTVRAAARHLTTVCPFCLEDVPDGSGTRQVIPVPVVGSVGAGKTQLLTAVVAALDSRAQALLGTLTPLSPVAESFLTSARATVVGHHVVTKTPWEDQPEGLPMALELGKRDVELQFMDASGESFADWERSQNLAYIDTSDVLLVVVDPLAIPEVGALYREASLAGTVLVAEGDPEDAYGSVVDRLRAAAVRLDKRNLAVVITKADVLRQLPDSAALGGPSHDIRSWLLNHGADGFVRRIDHDFKKVTYFAVDSVSSTMPLHDPLHPFGVIAWVLETAGVRLPLRVTAPPDPAASGEPEEVLA